MFCQNCGKDITEKEGLQFCKYCGSSLKPPKKKPRAKKRKKSHLMAIFVIAILAVAIGYFVYSSVFYDSEKLFSEYSESIVSISTADKRGKDLGYGSGVVVSKDGLILTNSHVLKDGSSAIVKLSNGAFYPVTNFLIDDPFYDLATIKIDAKNLKAISDYGLRADVHVGEKVFCIGNPRGLENTISQGIVSAIRGSKYQTLIQATAPISTGSSGGAMFNDRGELIGITSAFIERGQNLNFAVPIQDALYQIYSHIFLNKRYPAIVQGDIAEYLARDKDTLMSLAESVAKSEEYFEQTIENLSKKRGISRKAAVRRLVRKEGVLEDLTNHLEASQSLEERLKIHDEIVKKYNKMYIKK